MTVMPAHLESLEQATAHLQNQQTQLPPNAAIHIVFSPHASTSDLGDYNVFKARVKNADIYIPEEISWTEKARADMNAISKGNKNVYDSYRKAFAAHKKDFLYGITGAIFASRIAVDYVDLGRGDPFYQEVKSYVVPKSHSTHEDGLLSLETRLSQDDLSLQETIAGNRYREALMITRLGKVLQQTIVSNPKLRSKDQVNVLMTLGSVHTSVFHKLRKVADNPGLITRSFGSEKPFFISSRQLLRAGLFGIELSDNAKARLLGMSVVEAMTKSLAVTLHTEQWMKLTRYQQASILSRVARNFYSEEAVRALFELDSDMELTTEAQKAFAELDGILQAALY